MGIGSVRLEGPRVVTPYTFQEWTLVYTAGRGGIRAGGGVRLAARHTWGWSEPQTENPEAEGYVTVGASHDVIDSVYIEFQKNVWGILFNQYHPWQNIIEVTVRDPGLASGETIRVKIGDRSGGSPGVRIQPYDEFPFSFKTYADPAGTGEYLPLGNNVFITIRAAEPHRLDMVMPSNAVQGAGTWCRVRAEDLYGNPATSYRGTIFFESESEGAVYPVSYTFTKEDNGVHRFENLVFHKAGLISVSVRDGEMTCTSNPVSVTERRAERLLLWGDIHGHTLFSDGTGTVEEYYDFAERVATLDFCAVSDHAFQQPDRMWEHSKRVTARFNKPGMFVTFPGYEWSGQREVGGDHNVYFLDADPPIYRSRSFYNYVNFQMYHGPEPQVNHVEDLYAKLKQHLRNKNVFCIPHSQGRTAIPDWHDSDVERLIEIINWRWTREEWAETFLSKGYRLGFMGSADDHYGNPGYNYPINTRGGEGTEHDFETQKMGNALTGVYADEFTREAIIHALYERRCYATTGERIILRFSADGHIMGSEYRTTQAPLLAIDVTGTSPISLIEIKKDSRVVHSEKSGRKSLCMEWRDPDFQDKSAHYYYVRILQVDGEEALSSPVWIN